MIPTTDDLRSAPLIHRTNDLFNPPGLTNFLGTVQVAEDLTGIRSINFPPFCGSDMITAGLYLDDCYFPALNLPVSYTWYPDRIIRSCEYKGLKLESVTSLVVGKQAVIIQLLIRNQRGTEADLRLRLRFQGGVTRSLDKWADFMPPSENNNLVEIDESRKALLFTARHSKACILQGITPSTVELDRLGGSTSIILSAGSSQKLSVVYVLGQTAHTVQTDYDTIINDIPGHLQRTRSDWNAELKAIFTPGNNRYSGSLPELETGNAAIQKLYYTGILGVIYFKRDNPHSVYGRAYDTLMPRYWQTVTFLWDYSLSSNVHAILDPEVMRKYLEFWMGKNIHQHFGTDYLTGGSVGPWYSVNDYAMLRMSNDYLRWSGKTDWLDQNISTNRSTIDYLEEYAGYWRNFKSAIGLADYGGIDNLLECVSTYTHQVASLNAGNVFNLRFIAELLTARGKNDESKVYRAEASELLDRIQELYVAGGGFWKTRQPDGQVVEVRHCYDFITVLNTIAQDLSAQQRSEMTRYFMEDLQTKNWIRALSPKDQDAIFSVRPDHQWNGAYPAWPAQAVSGLYRLGQPDIAYEWMQGLAESANQGPFGQAHFVETAAPPEAGGARKAPYEMPYITDWAVSSGGSWVDIIIESIFGVKASIFDGISAQPQFGPFDSNAELYNLAYQGKLYTVDRKGIKQSE